MPTYPEEIGGLNVVPGGQIGELPPSPLEGHLVEKISTIAPAKLLGYAPALCLKKRRTVLTFALLVSILSAAKLTYISLEFVSKENPSIPTINHWLSGTVIFKGLP